jgi:hypothetical protein
METKAKTLMALLVASVNRPAFEVAQELGISSSSLTRHCQGSLRKPAVLKRVGGFFTKLVGGEVPVDDSLLTIKMSPAGLVALAEAIRTKNLRRGS